ncbi:hypothetical protein [Vallitalea maricola]|uniref:Uncharacterized protein n=1 Tax=Vallitalea maricola TaxID=3074433 RepID=A0ACB5UE89_9FIRM|nr:hypothetical protein AN2V17_01470 [Vallitalea sp. AN17-2]
MDNENLMILIQNSEDSEDSFCLYNINTNILKEIDTGKNLKFEKKYFILLTIVIQVNIVITIYMILKKTQPILLLVGIKLSLQITMVDMY